MKIVLIEWLDSYSYGGWHNPSSESDHVSNCISIGVLSHESDKDITISQSISLNTGNHADTISIPKGSITTYDH